MRCKQFIVIGGLMLTAQAALANPILDTSKPLICAATQVVNCAAGRIGVTPWAATVLVVPQPSSTPPVTTIGPPR